MRWNLCRRRITTRPAPTANGSSAATTWNFTTSAFEVVGIGRPTPGADGKIHLSFEPPWWVVGESYEARVSARGTDGGVPSALSNAFTFSGPCAFALSALTSSFGVAGGAGTVTVAFVVAANASASPRAVNVTLGGQTLTVVQAGTCLKTLDAPGGALLAAGGAGTVGVTAPSGCTWGSAGAAAWLQVTNGSGTGSAAVGYSAAANLCAQARSTTLTLAGVAFTVTQAAPSPVCVPMVSPSNLSIPALGASGNLAVSAPAGCAWTADSAAGWVRLYVSGMATARVGYRVDANLSALARTATLTIAGQTIVVTQSATAALTVLSPVSSGAPAGLTAGKTTGARPTAVRLVAALPTAAAPSVLPTRQARTLGGVPVSR